MSKSGRGTLPQLRQHSAELSKTAQLVRQRYAALRWVRLIPELDSSDTPLGAGRCELVKSTPNTQIDWQSVLSSIPNSWILTPVKAKRPLRDGWQTEAKLPRQELLRLLKEGQWLNKRSPKPGESTEWHCRWDGIGLRTGAISGGLVALDQDGPSAIPKILELSGGEELPKTIAFSSGREGRSQYLFRVPEEYWSAIETKKYKTGVKGDDGEIEQVELRWNGCQSVLPPSAHPLTEGYHYLPGCAPWECEIAVAPAWIIERMLCESSKPEPTPHTSQPKRHSTSSTYQTNDRWTDEQWAISYNWLRVLGKADPK